ncbi:hypothetical protein D9M68_997360 [compost metagenome]
MSNSRRLTSLPILATCVESMNSTSFSRSRVKTSSPTSCNGLGMMVVLAMSSGRSSDLSSSGYGSMNVARSVCPRKC